ncbi:MAG: hypothetical protein IJ870_02565 [Alphaproteobacteria bacterium]|nr:hypothetical protein [Alphaproteobacteria bacterium]
MTSVRQDLIDALRQYEEEERKRIERELREKEERIKQAAQNDVKSMYEPYLEDDEDEMLEDFYNHLKDSDFEGYSKTPYCDSEGKNTVGVGNRIPNYEAIKNLTMTSKDAAVSESNPAWGEDKKRDFMQKLDEFCKDRKNWFMIPKRQYEEYNTKYNETMPHFQDDELEELSKKYIRNTALPEIKRNVQNVGINFYHDLNRDGQKGLMDMQYNLGGNKFKLIDLEDPKQIDNSNLKYKNELKADANSYLRPEIRKDLIDNGYWAGLSNALKQRDVPAIQKEIHRSNISDKRNNKIRNLFANPWQKRATTVQNPYNQRENRLKNPWDEDDKWWY